MLSFYLFYILQASSNSRWRTTFIIVSYKWNLNSRATVLSKILNEQASSESRLDIQRAYDRIKLILSHKSDSWLEHSIKMGKSQQAREAEKKQVVDRLLKMFEKKIEMAGLVENFDRTEDEEELIDSKFKVGRFFLSLDRPEIVSIY